QRRYAQQTRRPAILTLTAHAFHLRRCIGRLGRLSAKKDYGSNDMTLMQVGLDDKYRLDAKRIYLSGVQALVRLPMLQRERDRAAGLNTAGLSPAIAARRWACTTT